MGTYTYDSSVSITVINQALDDPEFINNINGIQSGDYASALSPLKGNNLLLNSLCYNTLLSNFITEPHMSWDKVVDDNVSQYTRTYSSSGTTWTKVPAAGTQSYFDTKINNYWFKTGDTLYLKVSASYQLSALNVAGNYFTFNVYERSTTGVSTLNGSLSFTPQASSSFVTTTLPVTLTTSEIAQIWITVSGSSANPAGANIKVQEMYFGTNPNSILPAVQQVTYMGQDNVDRSGDKENADYKINDFLLNRFNQYYPASSLNATRIKYYIENYNMKSTLRFAPASIQLYSKFTEREQDYTIANYVQYDPNNPGAVTWSGQRNLHLGYFSATSGIYSTAGSVRFDISNALALDNFYRLNTTHIIVDHTRRPVQLLADSSSPTYGRRLIFKLVDTCDYDRQLYQLYYMNRHGGIDWLVMTGNNTTTDNVSSNTYKTNWRKLSGDTVVGDMSTSANTTINIEVQTSYTLNSDLLTDYEYNKLNEVVSSPHLWLFDATTEDLIKVNVVNNSYTSKQFRFDKYKNATIEVKRELKNYRNQK
jgi:hypothetical protein